MLAVVTYKERYRSQVSLCEAVLRFVRGLNWVKTLHPLQMVRISLMETMRVYTVTMSVKITTNR